MTLQILNFRFEDVLIYIAKSEHDRQLAFKLANILQNKLRTSDDRRIAICLRKKNAKLAVRQF